MRADAVRNRVRVLAAAREVFGDLGPDARMEEVAHRAGVGVGTLYRHFPTKEALLDALVSERLGEMAEAAGEAVREPDSWAALCGMIWRMLEIAAEDKALLRGIASTAPPLPQYEGSKETEGEPGSQPESRGAEVLIGELLSRAQKDGTVRGDVTAEDLTLMFSGVMGVALETPRKEGQGDDPWRRYVTILLDGLRETSRGAADR